jgi:hypothetical protein
MKTLKRLTALVLVGAMALSLAACGASKKKVTVKEFKKILGKADFEVEEREDDDAEECWVAEYSEDRDSGVSIYYYLFETKGDAKACFNASYDDLKAEEEDELFDGEIAKKSWYFTADGEFDKDSEIIEGEWYVVCVVAEESLLVCYSTSDKSSKKTLKKALSDLGYEIE